MADEVICESCGKPHAGAAIELAFKLPDDVFALPEQDRQSRCRISSDIVVLDDERFFIRGLVPLKVAKRNQDYALGVWAEVSEDVFGRIYDLWDDPDQSEAPRLPGTLANALPFHESTVGLTVAIQLIGTTSRPEFFLDPVEHSLFAEQSRGIDEHRAYEYSDRASRKSAAQQGREAQR
ncbi:DUF2199 domain-containing protein [Steroidobacter cummioxidans]|uniref:DUF2199 domain-containing protein n=1 Tax=Steroidobacter cummioxidans TaxID=1803913 RepID=UPI000E320D73|nr:DUF2199 domain-containing protein [Steroidobacter cummioxidans]